MALSNIVKEPRREIIETLVGIIASVPLLVLNYYVANAMYYGSLHDKDPMPWLLAFFFCAPLCIFIAAASIVAACIGVHTLGENICRELQERGIHLRPKQRGR